MAKIGQERYLTLLLYFWINWFCPKDNKRKRENISQRDKLGRNTGREVWKDNARTSLFSVSYLYHIIQKRYTVLLN